MVFTVWFYCQNFPLTCSLHTLQIVPELPLPLLLLRKQLKKKKSEHAVFLVILNRHIITMGNATNTASFLSQGFINVRKVYACKNHFFLFLGTKYFSPL